MKDIYKVTYSNGDFDIVQWKSNQDYAIVTELLASTEAESQGGKLLFHDRKWATSATPLHQKGLFLMVGLPYISPKLEEFFKNGSN